MDEHMEKLKKPVKIERGNILTLVLFATYMLLLIGIVLFKLPFYSPKFSDGIRVINLIPFGGSADNNGVIVWREIIQNILIFAPLGVYVSMLRSKWAIAKKILSIVCLALSFEVIQFIFAMGRSDVTDILGNTLGGIMGIVIYAMLLKVFKSKTTKILNLIALAVTVCVVLRFAQLFYLSHFTAMQPPLA